MFVHPADVAAQRPRGRPRSGSTRTVDKVRWTDIRDRVFGRIDPISAAGRDYRADRCPQHHAVRGPRPVHRPRRLHVDGPGRGAHRRPDRDRGGQPARRSRRRRRVGVPFHTSDTVMRIDALPERLVILGGGLHRRGVRPRVLRVRLRGLGDRAQQPDAAPPGRDGVRAVHRAGPRSAGTCTWAPSRCGSAATPARSCSTSPTATASAATCCSSPPDAAQRRPARPAGGGDPDPPDGRIVVDEYQRTPVDGVFALGDVSSPYQLKHVANHEARVVAHNLLHPDELRRDRPPVRAGGGVHRPADRRGRAHRASSAGTPGSTTR